MSLSTLEAARSLPRNLRPVYIVPADETGHVSREDFQTVRSVFRSVGGAALETDDPGAQRAASYLRGRGIDGDLGEAAALAYNEAATNAQRLGILRFLGVAEYRTGLSVSRHGIKLPRRVPAVVVADGWPDFDMPEAADTLAPDDYDADFDTQTHQGIGIVGDIASENGMEVTAVPAEFVNGSRERGKIVVVALGQVGLDRGILPEGQLGGIDLTGIV